MNNKKGSLFNLKLLTLSMCLVIAVSTMLAGCGKTAQQDRGEVTYVSINTEKGEIIVALRPDLMPVTVENFLKLANQGFYNGLTFHRVEDWLIQGGDPNGDGTGGPGWTIKLETHPSLLNKKYSIAMAHSKDPNSAGSQFYILKKDADWLDGKYAVFGTVVKGQDVVEMIRKGNKILEVKELKDYNPEESKQEKNE